MDENNNNKITDQIKNVAWNAKYAYNRSEIPKVAEEVKGVAKDAAFEVKHEMAKAGILPTNFKENFKRETDMVRNKFRPFRNRHLRGTYRRGLFDRIFDYFEQRRRNRVIYDELAADREEASINRTGDEIKSEINHSNSPSEIMKLEKAEQNLEDRKKDLETFRQEIEKEKKKFENLDLMLEGKEPLTDEPLSNVTTFPTPQSDATSLQVIDDNNVETPEPAEQDPNYVKLIAADGEGVSNFRTKYRMVQRSERQYRSREIMHALITGAAIAGVTYSMYMINPELANQTGISGMSQDVQTTLDALKNVVDNIMTNPTFENIKDVLSQGTAQLGFFTVVGVTQLRRTVTNHRLANDNRYEREQMEENNPLNIRDDVENIARHM